MKQMLITLGASLLVAVALSGCASDQIPATMYGTRPVEILSDPAGARIEVNNDYVGDTPITIQVPVSFAQGHPEYAHISGTTVIRAIPRIGGQWTQSKILSASSFTPLGVLPDGPSPTSPKRIFFDMNLRPVY